MKTLIVGAGGLGGIIGARLRAVGASVSLATRNATSAEEIKASGLRVTGIGGDLSIETGEVAPLADYSVSGSFDLIVLGHPCCRTSNGNVQPRLTSSMGTS
jgi:ketopantoate reductase